MKRTILPIIALTLTCLATLADEAMPLKIEATEKWKVKAIGQSYILVTSVEDKNAILQMSLLPDAGHKLIPNYVKTVGDGYLKRMSEEIIAKRLPSREYRIEKINGDEYSGEAAVFEFVDGGRHIDYMISNGTENWSGNITCSAELWKEAKTILEKLKKENKPE